jgi:hypothetical protein
MEQTSGARIIKREGPRQPPRPFSVADHLEPFVSRCEGTRDDSVAMSDRVWPASRQQEDIAALVRTGGRTVVQVQLNVALGDDVKRSPGVIERDGERRFHRAAEELLTSESYRSEQYR